MTKKSKDYELFKQAFFLVKNKDHLTDKGLNRILVLKASLNNGLPENLKKAFPNITPEAKPSLTSDQLPTTIDPNWIVGLTSGEGCFFINTYKSASKLGQSVQLVFQITQHTRDENLMNFLISYFDCGYIKVKQSQEFSWVDFTVTKYSDIENKIIPFFINYPIIGVKNLDFQDWLKAAEIIKNKAHLTDQGIEEIKKIKTGMNKGRTI